MFPKEGYIALVYASFGSRVFTRRFKLYLITQAPYVSRGILSTN